MIRPRRIRGLRPVGRRLWSWLHGQFLDPHRRVGWSLVLLALVLRLSHLDLIEYRVEHVEHLARSREIVGGLLPIVGAASPLGLPDPPLTEYMLALARLVSPDPRLAAGLLGALNAAAVGLLYGTCRRHYGGRVAIIAGALFAASPWGVLLSRRAGPEALMIPLAVALFHGLLRALSDHDAWGWVLTALALGLLLHTSLVAAPLLVVAALLVILYPRRAHWHHLALGSCFAALLFVPYVHYHNLNRFADLASLWATPSRRAGEAAVGWQAFAWAAWAQSGQRLSELMRPSDALFGLASPPWNRVAWAAGAVFLVSMPGLLVASLRAWARWRERRDPAAYLAPAVWLSVCLAAMAWHADLASCLMYAYALPVGFVAAGILADLLLASTLEGRLGQQRWAFLPRAIVWLGCLGLVLWSGYAVVYTYDFAEEHDTTGGYGVPYRYWRRLANLVNRAASETGTTQVWIVGERPLAAVGESSTLLGHLLSPELEVLALDERKGQAVPLPAEAPFLYLFLGSSSLAKGEIERLGGQEAGVVVLPDGSEARLVVSEALTASKLLGTIQHPSVWALEANITLLGYDWPATAAPGQPATLATCWLYDGPPALGPGAEYGIFYALALGERVVARCDGPALAPEYWHKGLVVKQWCSIALPSDLPSGEYDLVVELVQTPGQDADTGDGRQATIVSSARLGRMFVGGQVDEGSIP